MRTRVIAEIGTANHDIEWAHEAVDELAGTGVWAVKWQMLHPDTIATPTADRYDRLTGPATQHDAFTGALPYEAWSEVADHVREAGMVPMASCWDHEAVDAAVDVCGLGWLKVGSADITYRDMLRHVTQVARDGIVWSTGAATLHEAEVASRVFDTTAYTVAMACTLSYPCDDTDAYLARIPLLAREWIADAVGYSDHTRQTVTARHAVIAGASYLEKHVTVTPGVGGDHDFALTPDGMAEYVRQAALGEMWLGDTAWRVSDAEGAARRLARRSLWTVRDVREGEPVRVGWNVRWLRPTGGIEPDFCPDLWRFGRFTRNLGVGEPVTVEDLR
jgi:N,N'-diacetyllegionaminate synthase